MSEETSTKRSLGITAITVSGFKSIKDEQTIEVRPLTILAGANSSGKSSIMQPILLMKQTLEAPYDPGTLLLNGPNVKFTEVAQLLSRVENDKLVGEICVGIEVDSIATLKTSFRSSLRGSPRRFLILETRFNFNPVFGGDSMVLKPFMKHEDIMKNLPDNRLSLFMQLMKGAIEGEWSVRRQRCFLHLKFEELRKKSFSMRNFIEHIVMPELAPGDPFELRLKELIHVPGLRGTPQRHYPIAAVDTIFPGAFQDYTASVIAQWQYTDPAKIEALELCLEKLGLTGAVEARHLNDAQVELRVSRRKKREREKKTELVGIADVGFGVSQVMPVLVALLAAEPGQTVYIEQPELHLHPRAQTAMAEVLADAAQRGVRVIVETHSPLLLLAVQTLTAEDKLSPDLVKLHWFSLDDEGYTQIKSADLDEAGAFGDWPEDFGEVELKAESRYLDAAEKKVLGL